MKGTLLSTDYVRARDNSIRFIEANTNTIVYNDILDVEFSWQPFVNHLASGSYNTLHIVSKPEIQYESVKNLKAKVADQLPSLAISESNIGLGDDYPESIADAEDKFILRLAYDGNAIIDSIYCANSFAALDLFHAHDLANHCVPFYGISSSVEINHLNTEYLDANVPDAVVKIKDQPNTDVEFWKVDNWTSFTSSLSDGSYVTSFEIASQSLADNVCQSFRNYAVAYGPLLDAIDLGTSIVYAPFSLPTVDQLWIGGLTGSQALMHKHYYEFSTSVVKAQRRREGLYNTEHFVSSSGADLQIADTKIGDVIKSFYVPGLPDTDNPAVYSNYTISGNQWPSGSVITGSTVTSEVHSHGNSEGVVFGLKFAGSDERYYVGPTTQILTYHTGSNDIKFRSVSEIDEDDIYLIDINSNIVDIEENKMIVLKYPTGSFRSVNLEPTDNIIVGDTPYFFAYHNSKSDINLKKDIEFVGKSKKGYNIYNWTWKDQRDGVGRYQGVIAQEVPHAQVDLGEGFLRVDYSKVDVEFKKLK